MYIVNKNGGLTNIVLDTIILADLNNFEIKETDKMEMKLSISQALVGGLLVFINGEDNYCYNGGDNNERLIFLESLEYNKEMYLFDVCLTIKPITEKTLMSSYMKAKDLLEKSLGIRMDPGETKEEKDAKEQAEELVGDGVCLTQIGMNVQAYKGEYTAHGARHVSTSDNPYTIWQDAAHFLENNKLNI